jgi:hypothetical protein
VERRNKPMSGKSFIGCIVALIGFKVDSNSLWITDVHGKQISLALV